jgi:ribosomal protein L32
MISVDIYVPVLGKSYDFSLDEDASVAALLEELCDMICQHERWPAVAAPQNLLLSCPQTGSVLEPHRSLCDCGVRTGYRLLLPGTVYPILSAVCRIFKNQNGAVLYS